MKKFLTVTFLILFAVIYTVSAAAADDFLYMPSTAYQDGYIPSMNNVSLFSDETADTDASGGENTGTEDAGSEDAGEEDTGSDNTDSGSTDSGDTDSDGTDSGGTDTEDPEPEPEPIDAETLEAVKADIVAGWTAADRYINLEHYDFSYDQFKSYVLSIYSDILNENPEFFYVNGTVKYSTSLKIIEPVYNYTAEEIPDVKAKFDNAVANAVSAIDTDDMNDIDIAIILHDYLVINAEYDMDTYENLDGTKHESFSAYGVLVNKIGVCQSYTLAYNYLLGLFDIETSFISAVLPNGVGHIWSLVKLGDCYYHTDVTWDDPVPDRKGNADHAFFLLNDAEFLSDGTHGTEWENPYPNDSEYFSSAFWKNSKSGMAYLDGRFYFSSRNGTYRLNSADTDTVSEFTELRELTGTGWKIAGLDKTYSGGLFSVNPFIIDGSIYYNNARAIYKFSPEADEDTVVYTHTNTYGFILPQPHKSDPTVILRLLEYVDPSDKSLFEYSDDITVYLTPMSGDINCNGTVEATDSVYISRYLAHWSGYEVLPIESSCDINADGLVNANDSVILSRHIASWTGYAKLPYSA